MMYRYHPQHQHQADHSGAPRRARRRWRQVIRVEDRVLGVILLASPLGLAAQPRPSVAPVPAAVRAPVDTVPQGVAQGATPVQLASITTDTGTFAEGHKDFQRYTTPGLCAAAAGLTAEVLRNDLAAVDVYDTLRLLPDKDTLPAKARAVARACGAKFTLQNTPAADWPALFDVALLEGNDSLAQAVATRLIATAATPEARDTVLHTVFAAYLGTPVAGLHRVEPARPTLAAALATTYHLGALPAGSLDSTAVKAAIAWHADYLQYGLATHTPALVDQELTQISALAHTFAHARPSSKATAGIGRSLFAAYAAVMQQAVTVSPDSLHAVAVRVQRDLQAFPSDSICAPWGGFGPHCRTASLEMLAALLAPAFPQGSGWTASAEAPWRLHAAFWFPPKGASAADTVFPVPGKVTLVVHNMQACSRDHEWIVWFSCDAKELDAVRRYVDRYGAQGLKVVIVSFTRGWSYLSRELTPVQEAARIRWYYQDFIGLPVTVAVQVPTPEVRLPDGRRGLGQWDSTQQAWIDSAIYDNAQIEGHWYEGSMRLMDPHGTLLAQVQTNGFGGEDPFDEAIKRALRTVTAMGASTGASTAASTPVSAPVSSSPAAPR